jgi:hypothetical protein
MQVYNASFIFLYTVPLKSTAIVKSANLFKCILFFSSSKIRQKYLIVFGECAKSLKAYTEITAILEWFCIY